MNEILDKIRLPGIGLLISGITNSFFGLAILVSCIVQALTGQLERSFASDEEKIGYFVGFFGFGALGLITLAISPIIIYGAIQMIKGRKYGLSRAAAVLSILPFTSCCMLVGVPMGIWAFIVLNNPDVRAYFKRNF